MCCAKRAATLSQLSTILESSWEIFTASEWPHSRAERASLLQMPFCVEIRRREATRGEGSSDESRGEALKNKLNYFIVLRKYLVIVKVIIQLWVHVKVIVIGIDIVKLIIKVIVTVIAKVTIIVLVIVILLVIVTQEKKEE